MNDDEMEEIAEQVQQVLMNLDEKDELEAKTVYEVKKKVADELGIQLELTDIKKIVLAFGYIDHMVTQVKQKEMKSDMHYG